MSKLDLDFTGVQSFNNLGIGTFTVRISAAEAKKAQTGSNQLQITFEEPTSGATKTAWYSLVPTALWKVKRLFEAIGIQVPDGKLSIDTKNIEGKYCNITIEEDPNDATRTIVTREFAPSKVESATTEIPQAPVAPAPTMAAPVAPQPQVAQPVVQQPVVQPQPAAPQGNLPPWMQQPAQPAQSAPAGNLPPWMQQ